MLTLYLDHYLKKIYAIQRKGWFVHYKQLLIGFDGMSFLMYHLRRLTLVKEVAETLDISFRPAVEYDRKSRWLKGLRQHRQPKDRAFQY